MPSFKDHFSKQSDLYARYRPSYPKELYVHLALLCKAHELAWDCGTGNGQAATELADHFKQVTATDPSEAQIKNAPACTGVSYRVEKAEHTSLLSQSVDLVTVANALHWFDFDLFYEEVQRVLKPHGIIAVWCYMLPSITPKIDEIIRHYHYVVLNDYWLPENRLVEKEYQTIPFPFETLKSPAFFYEKNMNLDEIVGYLNTWSATQRYIDRNNKNPTEFLRNEFLKIWEDPALKIPVRWNLTLKTGKNRPV